VTEPELSDALDGLRKVAEKHGCGLTANLAPACSQADLERLNEFLGAPAPVSLVEILRTHNGISLCFYDVRDSRAPEDRFAYRKLLVYGVRELMVMTKDMRDFIDVEDEADRLRAYRCFDWASVDSVLNRVVFSLDAPRGNAEYAVFDAGLDTSDWIFALRNTDENAVANSVGEFFKRSVECMLQTESSFAFWDTADIARPVWPD
jgi:hypothetical protein